MTTEKTLTIGRLARQAQVNVETVRYYERVGLVQQPRKPASGYRQYPVELVKRIGFIKQAQSYGFTLNEIRELLALGDGRCSDVKNRAIEKKAHIEQQIADLTRLRDTLNELISRCKSNDDSYTCPIIETLY